MAKRKRRASGGKGSQGSCKRAFQSCFARASGRGKSAQRARGRCLARLNSCRRK